MSGISSTLNIAKTAVAAQQYGLNVTGHNIANVNNPDYSRQNADHISNKPAPYAGFLFGTGVNVNEVEQIVDTLLENRLTSEKSAQTMFEEAEGYMRVLEGFFDENSSASMNAILSEFWNGWHDLSDNPLGVSERVQVLEKGQKLSERFNELSFDLNKVSNDITFEISSAIISVNSLTSQIADLNREIVGLEANRTANDLRDQRNSLIDQLGEYINVDVISTNDGGVILNVANGASLVNGVDSSNLATSNDRVMWQGSFGQQFDITDDISGGKLAGWLEIRDEVIPKYSSQIDELAREMIWAINYNNTQGVGLEYYSDSLTGTYKVDDGGWLTSYDFGDKIDFSKDLTIWTEDKSSAITEYNKATIDMGISTAALTNWDGTAPGGNQVRYKLTVLDGAQIGDQVVTQTTGDRLAEIWSTSSGTAATALDNIMANQTLTIYGSESGTQKIRIQDAGGDAKRSAASIAEELNKIEGINAYASKTEAQLDILGITNAQDGDTVKYTVYVDGITYDQSFVVDSNTGTLSVQFEDSLVAAVNSINTLNGDADLYSDSLMFSSDKGATLGIQNLEVQDNAGITLDNFLNFNNTDTVTFKITTDGIPTTSKDISIDLASVTDTTNQSLMMNAFYTELRTALADGPFTIERDALTDSITIRTTDGSNITLRDAGNDSGNDATFDITELAGTSTSGVGNTSLEFTAAANDIETFNSDTTSGDTVNFSMLSSFTTAASGTTSVITESTFTGGTATTAAVITGTITAVMDSGISILSDTKTTLGLFGTSGAASTGSSIMTLGGEDGFTNFTAGETVTFDVDGNTVSWTVSTAAGGTTEISLAQQLMTELNNDLGTTDYQFIRNGKSVSILKNTSFEEPISITNFAETGGNDAKLSLKTGTGVGTNEPENDLLEAGNVYRDFSTSSLYADQAVIRWEKYDARGDSLGERGLITVEDEETVSIVESGSQTLFFDLGKGSLVAGNTLTINMDEAGHPDPLNMSIVRQAKSVNDIYQFKVVSGGKVGHEPDAGEEPLTIEWSSAISSGSFIIQGDTPPKTPISPVEVTVDGMVLSFYDGTLFKDDVFTITTDDSGFPVSTNSDGRMTAESMSDWHWTMESFTDQINRQTGGIRASVTMDNQLKIQAYDEYHVVENLEYSGSNGFSTENVTIDVLDWTALDFNAQDYQLVRSSSGSWGILNDSTGGVAQIIPAGGDDDGFKIDFSGDGVGDIEIKFNKKVTGDGYVRFDLIKHNQTDIGFAFGDSNAESSGILAAAGINTFFQGWDAQTMDVNENLRDSKYIAAGKIEASTGLITQGDNRNALALADAQYQSNTLKQWDFSRGFEAQSSLVESSFDEYYNAMIGSLGVEARSIKTSREFSDIMVNQLTEQRGSISAVSLDEEMIKLMKYQHAFSAASKLLTVADEMLTTLISVR